MNLHITSLRVHWFSGFYGFTGFLDFIGFLDFTGFLGFTGLAGIVYSLLFPAFSPQIWNASHLDLLAPPQLKNICSASGVLCTLQGVPWIFLNMSIRFTERPLARVNGEWTESEL